MRGLRLQLPEQLLGLIEIRLEPGLIGRNLQQQAFLADLLNQLLDVILGGLDALAIVLDLDRSVDRAQVIGRYGTRPLPRNRRRPESPVLDAQPLVERTKSRRISLCRLFRLLRGLVHIRFNLGPEHIDRTIEE
jgi:hypothetical protein